jgi:hypothetical protein
VFFLLGLCFLYQAEGPGRPDLQVPLALAEPPVRADRPATVAFHPLAVFEYTAADLFGLAGLGVFATAMLTTFLTLLLRGVCRGAAPVACLRRPILLCSTLCKSATRSCSH